MRALKIAAAIVAAQPVAAFDKLLCVGDQSTGFVFDGSGWKQTPFRAESEKFVLAELPPELSADGRGVAATDLGGRNPTY